MRGGADPNTSPIYYYVYNGHGDVDALTDSQGNTVASYTYDEWGNIVSTTGTFANGWVNPYRYDGRDRPLLAERARLRSQTGPLPQP